MFRSSPASGHRIGVAAASLLLITACAAEGTTKTQADRIVGNRKGPDGERIAFSADRKSTSSGLDSRKLAETDCPGGAAGGSWGFMVDSGTSGFRSETAESGSWIGLGFRREHFGCVLELAVVDGGKTLCATDDPDTPCGLDVRFTREK
ncbi:hypothetical protein SUDANB58_04994 [Streptomyces sp. enrichment culture]|uniref:hypothetical protein n=1 Tax=Streptomyces sp. enrichment culture TaxID=1795815 RepID=UPI003F57DB40